MGHNDALHTEPTGYVPKKKMGPGYYRDEEAISTLLYGGRESAPSAWKQARIDPSLAELAAMRKESLEIRDVMLRATEEASSTHFIGIGIGGAPTRATTLPTDAAERKKYPLATGFFDYFPDAIVAVSHVSWVGGNQHHPGAPLHWDRSKSTDESDTMLRHFAQRGTRDIDNVRHLAKAAWRVLAMLQKEIEEEGKTAAPQQSTEKDPKFDYEKALSMQCWDRHNGWVCTRPKGHTLPHAAHYDNGVDSLHFRESW